MKLKNSLRSCLQAAACAAIAVGIVIGNGCKKEETAGTAGTPAAPGGKTTTIGFIYVGTKTDYGYNQAMADGAAAVKTLPGSPVELPADDRRNRVFGWILTLIPRVGIVRPF